MTLNGIKFVDHSQSNLSTKAGTLGVDINYIKLYNFTPLNSAPTRCKRFGNVVGFIVYPDQYAPGIQVIQPVASAPCTFICLHSPYYDIEVVNHTYVRQAKRWDLVTIAAYSVFHDMRNIHYDILKGIGVLKLQPSMAKYVFKRHCTWPDKLYV